MNTKRIFTWGSFIVIVGLITWGMIAASNKADKESVSIAPPDKVTSADWTKGATSSAKILVEYSDFQCPACAAYYPIIEQLLAENPDKVLFVYRHFPLPQHGNAIPAAQAAEAAGKQGKFWDMYGIIFTNQKSWESSEDAKSIFIGYATTLGLDIVQFTTDYESEVIKDKITSDLKSGVKAGVNSTPSFYLDGKKINPTNYEEFKKLIDETATSTTNS